MATCGYLEVGKVGDIVGRAHGVELEEGAALAGHGRHLHCPLYVQLSLRVSLRTSRTHTVLFGAVLWIRIR